MSHLLRKHKKPILWVIIILIVIAFGVLGTFSTALRTQRSAQTPDGRPVDDQSDVVAEVQGVPITAAMVRRQLSRELEQRRSYGQDDVTYADLLEDGTADRVLDQIVNTVLVQEEMDKLALRFDRDFLIDELKNQFTDEEGNFNGASYNMFIDRVESTPGVTWDAVYNDVARQVSMDIVRNNITAPARVRADEVRSEFEKNYTTIEVRYLALSPEITLSQEEIRAQYEENLERYQDPAERVADVVVFSLTPPRPTELLNEIVSKARGAADFSELAAEYSETPDGEQGGDLGWLAPQAQPEHQKVVFDLPVGAVSDPVQDAGGSYHVYKVLEERTNTETGEREVRAAKITVRPTLSETQKNARLNDANAFATKAEETGNLRAAAELEGLPVATTNAFSTQSTQIDGVESSDTYRFRVAFEDLDEGDVTGVIEARQNLYVAQVRNYTAPVQLPFEEVAERAEQDARRMVEMSPEYREKTQALAVQAAQKADSLSDVQQLYPEATSSIELAGPFSMRDYRPSGGVYWRPEEVYEAVGRGEPGAFGGPVYDYRGQAYFFELVSRTSPTQEQWDEKWPEEKQQIRTRIVEQRQRAFFEDYLSYLRMQAEKKGAITQDRIALAKAFAPVEPPAEPPVEEQGTASETPVDEPQVTAPLSTETEATADTSAEDAPSAE